MSHIRFTRCIGRIRRALLRAQGVAFRAQVERFAAGPGFYAFSRMDRDEKVEYVVAVNNSAAEQTASFAVYAVDAGFSRIVGSGGVATMTSSSGGRTDAGLCLPRLRHLHGGRCSASGRDRCARHRHHDAGRREVKLEYETLDGNSVGGLG